jgi:hypothetical protein
MKHEPAWHEGRTRDDTPTEDVAILVGNVLRGAGYAIQESGRLIAEFGAEHEAAAKSTAIDLRGLQVLGTLVPVGDDLSAERVILATFEDEAASHIAIVDWGDGTAETSGTVVSHGRTGFSVIGDHHYSRPGEFAITIRISRGDAVLAVATATALVGSDNRRFAACVFQALTGRLMETADEPNISEETREAILHSILASSDFRARAVADVYSKMLGREPDTSELAHGIELLANGSASPLKATIASSAEYFEKRGSAEPGIFANTLYSDLLARAPQNTEIDAAVRAAAKETTRLQLATQILQSVEGRIQIAQAAAQLYTNRNAAIDELVAAITAKETIDNEIITRIFVTELSAGTRDGLAADAVADFAIQFTIIDPDDFQSAVKKVQGQLKKLFPGAALDVRTFYGNEPKLLAVWLSPGNSDHREAWMARTVDFAHGIPIVHEIIGFFASLNFLKQLAKTAFASIPKNPDPGGTILLTGIDVSLDAAHNAVITHVSGIKSVDVLIESYGIHFTLNIKDTLEYNNSKVATDCAGTQFQAIAVTSSASPDVDDEDKAIAVLLGLLVGFTDPAFGVAAAGNLFAALSGQPNLPAGVGAQFMNTLSNALGTVLLAGGGKEAFLYDQPVVDASGLTVQVSVKSAVRAPSVKIIGPDFIPFFKVGSPIDTLRQQYSAQPCDLRFDDDNPLPVVWTATDPSTVIENPHLTPTFVRFGGGIASIPVGSGTTRTLRVTVGPDLDGQSRESTLSVFISVFERLPPLPGHLPPLKPQQ